VRPTPKGPVFAVSNLPAHLLAIFLGMAPGI